MEYNQDPSRFTSLQSGLSSPNHLTEPRLDDYTDQTDISKSGLETILDEGSYASDCESSVTSPVCDQSPSICDGLIELPEHDRVHDLIKRRFLSCLGSLEDHCRVLSIHRNGFPGIEGQSRCQTFKIFSKAMEQKHGGKANVKFAWFTATKNEIRDILKHGFGEPNNNGLYGDGVYLSPDNCPVECVRSSVADGDGLRYLLLCRVILGKSEVVHPFPNQSCPSSAEFDSGVDSLTSPKNYIIWSTHMNTHILPHFVVSFRAPANLRESVRIPDCLRKPTSPRIPLPNLMIAFAKFLPLSSLRLALKHYKDLREKKISRFELVQRLRRITGDRMLMEIVIKSFKDKVRK